MNTENMIISEAAEKLVQVGFIGFNGCGSGIMSKLACRLILLPLPSKIIKDLKVCWFIHDAEYTVSTSIKSNEHKVFADESLLHNMISVLSKHDATGKIPLLIVSLIHTSLILGGEEAYWQKKSNNTNWIPNVVLGTAFLYLLYRSFL